MAEGKGRKEEARDRLADELWLAAIAIGVIVIREAVKRTPDAIEWGARNAPKAARAAGQAGARAAGAAKQGALTIGKGVMTRLGRRRSEPSDEQAAESSGAARPGAPEHNVLNSDRAAAGPPHSPRTLQKHSKASE